ncbi:MAG: energy-coupling factor transporter transmembrane component T [Spirochaetia bacterium]
MSTPDWLLREESYTPRTDKDAFIDKSIHTLLRLLGLLRRRTDDRAKRGRIDPRVALASTFTLVLLVSLTRSSLFLACVGTFLLVVLSLHRGEIIRDVAQSSIAAGLFALAIMLPSAFWGNTAGAVRLTVKVLISVASVRFFSATMEWRNVTRALAAFRVPDLFILVLDITLSSLALLGKLSLTLLCTLRLRSVGRNPAKTHALSGIAGTLFLRSQQMTEDMHAAMECRCFTGSYRTGRAARLRALDCLPMALNGALIGLFVFTGA